MTTRQEFDFSVDLLQVLLWEMNKATALPAILTAKQTWYSTAHTAFWQAWRTNVFDMRTANEFGLYVWARILDTNITISDGTARASNIFGFDKTHKNFTRGNFAGVSSGTVEVSLEEARTLLRIRYFQLTTNGTVTQVNAFLAYLFGSQGGAHVIDNLDMTMYYVFKFELSERLLSALQFFDVLPRPSGVKLLKIVTPGTRIFGWDQDDDLVGGWNAAQWRY